MITSDESEGTLNESVFAYFKVPYQPHFMLRVCFVVAVTQLGTVASPVISQHYPLTEVSVEHLTTFVYLIV